METMKKITFFRDLIAQLICHRTSNVRCVYIEYAGSGSESKALNQLRILYISQYFQCENIRTKQKNYLVVCGVAVH